MNESYVSVSASKGMCPQKDPKLPHALERRYGQTQGGCGLQIPELSQSKTPEPGTKDSDGRCGYNTPGSQMGQGFRINL